MGQYLNFNKNINKKEPQIFIELISTTLLKNGVDLFDEYNENKLTELYLQRNWAVKSIIKKKIQKLPQKLPELNQIFINLSKQYLEFETFVPLYGYHPNPRGKGQIFTIDHRNDWMIANDAFISNQAGFLKLKLVEYDYHFLVVLKRKKKQQQVDQKQLAS